MERIASRGRGRVDDPFGPLVLAGAMVVLLIASAAATIMHV
jgi:hypothetical protein